MAKILLLSVVVLRAIVATDPLASDKNPFELDSTNTSDDYHIHSDALSSHSIPEIFSGPFDYSSDDHSGDYSPDDGSGDYSSVDDYHSDYSDLNPIPVSGGEDVCAEQHLCLKYSPYLTCRCDPDCVAYSDCCEDALYFSVKTDEEKKFECVTVSGGESIYMVISCPLQWQDSRVSSLCASGTDTLEIEKSRDPVMHLPATSTTTNITYSNYYCAICNQDSRNLYVWRPVFKCRELPYLTRSDGNEEDVNQKMVFEGGKWVLSKNAQMFLDLRCSIFPEYYGSVRQCTNNVISSCALNWTDSETENLCRSYEGFVYGSMSAKLYKNRHCALCNHAIPICRYMFNSVQSTYYSLSVLIDFTDASGSNTVDSISCNANEIFDPFSRRCRDVVNGEHRKFWFKPHSPANTHLNISVSGKKITNNRTCEIISLEEGEYVMLENKGLHTKKYDKIFEEGDYEVNETGTVLVCLPSLSLPHKFSETLGWVTLVGLGISCLCLILHLFAFSLVPHLRNLPGKNLASFCVSLLSAYISFIIGGLVQPQTNECYILAATTYFSFMASFSWMNIMAFDIWHTFRRSTKNLQVASGEQWHKFLMYSSYGWSFPSLALIITITIDKVEPSSFSLEYLPSLGENICWFGKRKALLVFFAVPLFLAVAINIILFTAATAMISTATVSTAATTSVSHHKKQFLLYVRLASIMGFTWLSGIFAAFFQVEALWYIFVVLNTLQGAFVFLAFTCRKRVLKKVALTCSKWPLVSYISGFCHCLPYLKVATDECNAKKNNTVTTNLCGSTLYSTGTSIDQSASSPVTSTI